MGRSMSFKTWLKKSSIDNLFETHGGMVTWMGGEAYIVFKEMKSALAEVIRDGFSVKNLWKTRISIKKMGKSGKRVILHFPKKSKSRGIKGIESNLKQLHHMVNATFDTLSHKNDERKLVEDTLDFFNGELYKKFKGSHMEEMKEFAFFIFSHPIFYNSEEYWKFIFKVDELKKHNATVFGKKGVTLDTKDCSMKGWNRRMTKSQMKTIKSTLGFPQNQQSYNLPTGVIPFLRNALTHLSGTEENSQVLLEILNLLPEALPSIHYALYKEYGFTKLINGKTLYEHLNSTGIFAFGYKLK